jgi:bleomycin hydrolase
MKHALIPIIIFAAGFMLSAVAQNHPDFDITHQCKTSSVKSQDRAGTCWAYTAVSFLESEILRKGGETYDLAEMYIVRNVYPVKAERYIRMHGNNNFGQGGQAHDAISAFADHGMVPESVYPGINYGGEIHNHAVLERNLKTTVEYFTNTKRALPENWINHYEAVLDGFLGKKPETFEYKGKSYSDRSFARQLEINPDDYVEISSYSHHRFNAPFVLEVPDNWSHDLYYNVTIDDLLAIMKNSLENGYSVSWDGDVSGDGFSHKDGKAALLDEEKALLEEKGAQEFRQILFNNFTATDDHLMHLTGLAEDEAGNIWFQTKNSWGADSNEYGGYLYMSEDYIKGMTIAIMVHKDAIPKSIQKKLF